MTQPTYHFAARQTRGGEPTDAGRAFMPGIMRQLRGEAPDDKPRMRTYLCELAIGLTHEEGYSKQQIREGLREAKAKLEGDLFPLPHGAQLVDYTAADVPSLQITLKARFLPDDAKAKEALRENWAQVKSEAMARLGVETLRTRPFPRLSRDTGQGTMRG